jgi:hypothetical protein
LNPGSTCAETVAVSSRPRRYIRPVSDIVGKRVALLAI